MFEENPNTIFLEVVDNIVVNRHVGGTNHKLENWYKESYFVPIGWKKINDFFVPPEMTEEEFNSFSNNILLEINEIKEYYDSLLSSSHYKNNISDEVKKTVEEFILNFNIVHQKVNENIGWTLIYNDCRLSYKEPFNVRPNLENEV